MAPAFSPENVVRENEIIGQTFHFHEFHVFQAFFIFSRSNSTDYARK